MSVRRAMWSILLLFAGAAAAAPGGRRGTRVGHAALPPGVSLVAAGVWGGAISPDGAAFAHFTGTRSRALAIAPIEPDSDRAPALVKTGERSCASSACLDDRCARVEWAPDGGRVAVLVWLRALWWLRRVRALSSRGRRWLWA